METVAVKTQERDVTARLTKLMEIRAMSENWDPGNLKGPGLRNWSENKILHFEAVSTFLNFFGSFGWHFLS